MQSNPDSTVLIDVFRSPDRKPSDERAFMLGAVNVPAVVEHDGAGFVVRVPPRLAAFAAHHLWQYEQEQRSRPAPAAPARPRFPHAWIGSLAYAVVLVVVALAVVRGWWGPDTFDRGALDTLAIRAGQWWRAATALTLHLDIAHLVSNLGAGAAIGWVAARQLGVGHAWLLTLVAAVLSNLLEGFIGGADHRSVGASTAVFAALGLVAAHEWKQRGSAAQSWARRVAPLVVGIALLGLLGTGGGLPEPGGEGAGGTNLVAHALGFVMGAVLGVVAARPAVARRLRQAPQWASAALALGIIAAAWAQALAAQPHGG